MINLYFKHIYAVINLIDTRLDTLNKGRSRISDGLRDQLPAYAQEDDGEFVDDYEKERRILEEVKKLIEKEIDKVSFGFGMSTHQPKEQVSTVKKEQKSILGIPLEEDK